MYEHLSKRVNKVVKLAHQVAQGYDQEYVGTEHLLLAISEEGTGVGARVLQAHGVTYDKLKGQVDKLIQASLEDTWVFGRLPGSPHFRNVIAQAIEEARKLKNKEVCAEHLLLALLLEKGCVAQKALKELGLTVKQVREEIKELQATQEQQQ